MWHDLHSRSRKNWLWGLAIVAGTVVAYTPAMRGGFVWDDHDYVVNNDDLRSVGGLGRIWLDRFSQPQYYPLVFTSFWLEFRAFGTNPAGYHVVNILLHAANALLVWQLLRRLGVPGAWLAGAVFALHPVHVESVAWITERKNVLSAVCYLTAFHAYLCFRRLDTDDARSGSKSRSREGEAPAEPLLPGDSARREPRPPGFEITSSQPTENSGSARRQFSWYLFSLVLFVGALLSKSVTASFPAAVALVIWWKRGRLTWNSIWPLLPMLVLGAIASTNTAFLERNHVGAAGADWDFSPIDRCLIAGRALWFYARKLMWPYPLAFFYPRWQIDATQWWQFLFPLGCVAVVVALWVLRKRIGRGPLAAVFFFAGSLLPALGFVDFFPMFFSFVADHFQYLASIGIIALVVGTAVRFCATAPPDAQRMLAALVLLLLGLLSWNQSRDYRNLETLWRNTIAKNPQAFAARSNLARLLLDRARNRPNRELLDEAVFQLQQAIQDKPDYAIAYENLGVAYWLRGDLAEGIRQFRFALGIDPELAVARYNLADALTEAGELDEAHQHFKRLIASDPQDALPHIGLGRVLGLQGKTDESVKACRTAVRLDPRNARAHSALAMSLARAGDLKSAAEEFQRALKIEPLNSRWHSNLASLRSELDHDEEAEMHFRRAIALNPKFAEAHLNFGLLLHKLGNHADAAEQFRHAVRIRPNYQRAYFELGKTYFESKRFGKAACQFRELLRINPNHEGAKQKLLEVE